MAKSITWSRCGRNHIFVTFADQPGEDAFRAEWAVRQALAADTSDAVRGYVLAPTTALVRFHLRSGLSVSDWADGLVSALGKIAAARQPRQHRKRVRVRYDGRDLKRVAGLAKVAADDFARIHEITTYQVVAIGGFPAFVHLSGLDPRLHVPPPEKPCAKVKAGSVVIAGKDCFIVGAERSGAWHVIARIEEPFFNVERDPPFLLEPCDLVLFRARGDIETAGGVE